MGACEMPKTTYNNIVNVVASSSTNIGVNDQLDRGFRCWHCSTNAEEQNATHSTQPLHYYSPRGTRDSGYEYGVWEIFTKHWFLID